MSTSDMTGFPKKGDLDLLGVDSENKIIAQTPDGGVLGGNTRGTGAVDLQLSRTANTQVASGSYSVAMGQSNTASGTNAFAAGSTNVSNNTNSIALGNSNTSSGTYSFAAGTSCTASGAFSISIGDSCTASGDYSFCTGLSANAFGVYGKRVVGNVFAASGDAQKGVLVVRVLTSGATPGNLTSNGSSVSTNNQLTIQDDSAIAFEGIISAKQSGSSNVASWTIQGLLYRGTGAASTTLVTSSVTVVSNTPAWTGPSLTADTTNGALTITATGTAGASVRWTCSVESSEVTYA